MWVHRVIEGFYKEKIIIRDIVIQEDYSTYYY
jgi:hypothetical protein